MTEELTDEEIKDLARECAEKRRTINPFDPDSGGKFDSNYQDHINQVPKNQRGLFISLYLKAHKKLNEPWSEL